MVKDSDVPVILQAAPIVSRLRRCNGNYCIVFVFAAERNATTLNRISKATQSYGKYF